MTLLLSKKLTDLVCGRVADVVDGIMVFLLEELHLERQDREELVDIALDVFNAILLPRPDLRRYIIIDWDICLRFYIFCNIKIEAWIVHENHTVWLPLLDIRLAHTHITQYGGQVQ